MVALTLEDNDIIEGYKPDDLLDPQEAADYLAKRWKRRSFSIEGLRSLRRRIGLVPAKHTGRIALYARRQLDEIQQPLLRGPYIDKTE